MHDNNSQLMCNFIILAKQCLEMLVNCDSIDIGLIGFEEQLDLDSGHYNCTTVTQPPSTTTQPITTTSSTQTSTPSTPPPSACSLSSNRPTSLNAMDIATVIPDDPPTMHIIVASCPNRVPRALRQCSLYTHSHLRQWGSSEIHTCSLPGSWYMIKHRDVTVEVTGTAENAQSSFTRLTKVI